MKSYQVFYWIKKNGHEYLEHLFVVAKNQKEACSKVKAIVKEKTGRNAFRPTCTPPTKEEMEQWRRLPHFIVD